MAVQEIQEVDRIRVEKQELEKGFGHTAFRENQGVQSHPQTNC